MEKAFGYLYLTSLNLPQIPNPKIHGCWNEFSDKNQHPGDSTWPFDSPIVGGHLAFPKGHLYNHPKKVTFAEWPGWQCSHKYQLSQHLIGWVFWVYTDKTHPKSLNKSHHGPLKDEPVQKHSQKTQPVCSGFWGRHPYTPLFCPPTKRCESPGSMVWKFALLRNFLQWKSWRSKVPNHKSWWSCFQPISKKYATVKLDHETPKFGMNIKHVNTFEKNRSQLGSVGSKKTEVSPARFKEWIDYFLPNGETRVFGPRIIFCDGFCFTHSESLDDSCLLQAFWCLLQRTWHQSPHRNNHDEIHGKFPSLGMRHFFSD